MEYKATLRLNRPMTNNVMGLHVQNYDLLHSEYSFHKDTNKNGEVLSDVVGGTIRVVLPIFPTDELLAWVFDHGKKINGEIVIDDRHGEVIEKIYFEEARCVAFKLHYEPIERHNIVLQMTINVQRMKLGTIAYENAWR
ncbi:MAG: hypothetical protein RL662_675 [Bacteroidota bacterium]|jgi:hypothetical protein